PWSLCPLSPGVCAVNPLAQWSKLWETCALRMFPTTYSIERAPQARASERDGKQTDVIVRRAQNASVAPVEHTCYTSSNVHENTGGKREKSPWHPLVFVQAISTTCFCQSCQMPYYEMSTRNSEGA